METKLIQPQLRDYLKIGRNWLIRDLSEGVKQFSNSPSYLKSGQDIREVFPELRGLETILIDIFDGKRITHELPNLCRYSSQQPPRYFNLNFLLDQNNEHQLLILVEEAKASFDTVQTITQMSKESLLSMQEKETILNLISQQILRSLKFEEVLQYHITKIRHKLDCNRVFVHQVHTLQYKWQGRTIAESITPGYPSLLDSEINNPTLYQNWGKFYSNGEVHLITDMSRQGLDEETLQTLQNHQIQAQIILPLWISNSESEISFDMHLWGLLILQHHTPRYWYQQDLEMLKQLADYLSVSIQLERLAVIDFLTHLPNRRAFNSQLQQEWERLKREKKPLSLILCDVDYFSQFNNAYGHLNGDRCLQTIATILNRNAKRSSDIAARYGGEEFAIILPNTDSDGAYQVAEQIRTAIRNLHIEHCHSPQQFVTMSLGIASVIPDAALSLNTLVQNADRALLKAKESGKNCTVTD